MADRPLYEGLKAIVHQLDRIALALERAHPEPCHTQGCSNVGKRTHPAYISEAKFCDECFRVMTAGDNAAEEADR